MPTPENRGIIISPRCISIVVVVVFSLLAFYAQIKQSWLLLAILATAPFGLLLLSRIDIIAIMFIALYFSQLYYNKLPMNLTLCQIFMAVFVGVSFARMIITKAKTHASPSIKIGALCMAWLLFLMAFRGHSLTFFGSSMIGGAIYIHIFIAFGVYFFSGYMTLSEKQWKLAITLMISFIFVPFLCNLAIILSRGLFWQPLLFVKMSVGLAETFTGFVSSNHATRWAILHPFVLVYLLPVFMWPCEGRRNSVLYAFFFALSGAAALLSGYRNRLLHVLSFFVLFAILKSKRPLKTISILIVCGFLAFILMLVLAPHMPFGIQRVLTILPGVHVSAEAEIASAQTVEWRIALWTMVLENIPHYLLVGRGFGHDPAVLASIQRSAMKFGSIWMNAYATYYGVHMHQGVLDMLLFLGLPGLLILLSWWCAEIIHHIKLHYLDWNNEVYKRYHLALTVYFVVCVFQFLTYLGNIQVVLPDLIFQMALLNAVVVCDRSFSADQMKV